jgi:hypothetical protein
MDVKKVYHRLRMLENRVLGRIFGPKSEEVKGGWIKLHNENVVGGLVVACLPLDPKFAGSNPAEDDGFLRVIKVRSTTSFGGEVNIVDLRHVKEPYEHETDAS